MNNEYNDREIIEMLISDDKNKSDFAFRDIYNKYSVQIYSYCNKILKDRMKADDVFQETFINFYQNVKQEKINNGSVIGYLIKIARNKCLNVKRDLKHNVNTEDYKWITADEFNYYKQDKDKIIKSAIEKLEIKYKEPFILRVYEGLEYIEIAEICEISEENARKRVFRAKQKIKEFLNPFIDELSN